MHQYSGFIHLFIIFFNFNSIKTILRQVRIVPILQKNLIFKQKLAQIPKNAFFLLF